MGQLSPRIPPCTPQVPPMGKGSLYLRPLLLGSGPILGLGPAPSYTFTIFGAAVGAYFKVSTAPCARAHTHTHTITPWAPHPLAPSPSLLRLRARAAR